MMGEGFVQSVEILETGVLYRNPKPHVRSVHAYFPSVARLENGEMLATVALGEAFEAPNLRTHVFRSRDDGRTWGHEGPLCPETPRRIVSDVARLTALPGGSAVAFVIRHDRTEHPDDGLTNPDTLGFVPTELALARSTDAGRSWSPPEPIRTPIVGPSFEMCSPVVVLRDGRWIIPTSTWPGWAGDCPNGIVMGALVSHDAGRTWPDYLPVMREDGGRVFFWESKILELPDGRLVAVAWAHDDLAGKDRPNQYALSADGGRTWSAPASTGLHGQTLTPLVLGDGRLLCVYRRMDAPGLWAVRSRIEGDNWINDGQLPLWGGSAAGLTVSSGSMSADFAALRFGAPCLTPLDDGRIFAAFWCYEACVSIVRWFTLRAR